MQRLRCDLCRDLLGFVRVLMVKIVFREIVKNRVSGNCAKVVKFGREKYKELLEFLRVKSA